MNSQSILPAGPGTVSSGAMRAGARTGGLSLHWKRLASTALVLAFVAMPLARLGSAHAAPPVAQPSGVIQTQETRADGVVAELTECRRADGVLTIKVRFRNTADKPGHLTFVNWNGSAADNPKFYVTAGSKKYFMLADADGVVLSTNSTSSSVEANLDPGKSYLWWAKYPAPPADIKKINFIMPVASPFEDVAITDK
jgi:hypothetical protein